MTRQWVNFVLAIFGCLAVFVASVLMGYLSTQETVPTRVEQLTTDPTATLECKQLFGDERRYDKPNPQVECVADTYGLFVWQWKDNGEWYTFTYSQYPDYLMGFMFTTNPGS